jgi:hypothetical protein
MFLASDLMVDLEIASVAAPAASVTAARIGAQKQLHNFDAVYLKTEIEHLKDGVATFTDSPRWW